MTTAPCHAAVACGYLASRAVTTAFAAKGEGTMADTMTEARREAEADAADEKFSKLLKSLGATATAKAVFGEPVEKDGLTVVPVARVRFGLGGGSGRGPGRKKKGADGDAEQVGYGHGGGVQARTSRLHRAVRRQGELPAHRRSRAPHGHRAALPARRGDLLRHRGARLGAAHIAALTSPEQRNRADGSAPRREGYRLSVASLPAGRLPDYAFERRRCGQLPVRLRRGMGCRRPP